MAVSGLTAEFFSVSDDAYCEWDALPKDERKVSIAKHGGLDAASVVTLDLFSGRPTNGKARA